MFEIDVTPNDTFCIQGEGLPLNVLKTVRAIVLNNLTNSVDYKKSKACGAFLQGYNKNSGWLLVEFWSDNAEAIQDFIDYVNASVNLEFFNSKVYTDFDGNKFTIERLKFLIKGEHFESELLLLISDYQKAYKNGSPKSEQLAGFINAAIKLLEE